MILVDNTLNRLYLTGESFREENANSTKTACIFHFAEQNVISFV